MPSRALSLLPLAVLAGCAQQQGSEAMARADNGIDYVEFRTTDMAATQRFYREAFGWSFTDYGPDYTAFSGAGLDGGFAAAEDAPPEAGAGGALVVLYAADLEAAEARVRAAGGTIVRPIFSFPGGRRFHFLDPSGNELAIWSE